MTESEAARMAELLRTSWEDDFSREDFLEAAKAFRPYSVELVTEMIADRLEAEMTRPDRVELSRVLRAYDPKAAKTDPAPVPEPRRPQTPWVREMPDLPPVASDLPTRLAEARQALAVGSERFDQRPRHKPEPPPLTHTVVPPSVRLALENGSRLYQENRRERLASTERTSA